MKILYFVHGFPPSIGAGAINAFKIAKYLANFGHELLILSPGVFHKSSTFSELKNLSKLNIDVNYSSRLIKIPLNLIFSHVENMLKFLVILKKNFNPDLVLSQYQAYHYASVVGGYTSKILNIPHIIRSHDIFFLRNQLNYPLKLFHLLTYPRIYKSISNSNTFYVTSSEMKKYFSRFKSLREVDFKIHHNGINTNEFYPFHNQEELKNKFGCENILLFIGTISKDNNLQYFINALPETLQIHKDTHVLIIGDGPNKSSILKFIKKKGLANQIHYLGIKPHEEIPFYINNSDIGIGRFSYEKIWRYMIPVKCLEYMACEKPFITIPCSQDLIKNNDVGITVKKNFTKKDIVDNLLKLIEDRALRKKLGQNGLKKINQKFRWDNLMIKFNQEICQIARNFSY